MKKRTLLFAGILLFLSLGMMTQKAENLLNFDISPNPMGKYCEITLEFAEETPITLTIMNEREEVIRTLFSGTVYKSMSLTWERDDALGNIAPSGTYFVVVNCQSRYTSIKKTLILK